MPEDLKVGISFKTDQAIKDLESDLEDADIGTQASLRGQGAGPAQTGGGVGAGGILEGAGILEAGSDIGTGPKKGGILGSLAGGISKTVVLLGAIVGLLALLEPIQQILGFLLNQLELLVAPIVGVLTPVLQQLEKLVVGLIRFFRNPEQAFKGLINAITNALQGIANSLISGLNQIPGVNLNPVNLGDPAGKTNPGAGIQRTSGNAQGTQNANQAIQDAAITAISPFRGTVVNPFLAGLSGEDKKEVVSNQSSSTQNNFLGGLFG